MTRVGPTVELECSNPATVLHNGDGLCYYDLQREWWAWPSTAPSPPTAPGQWRVFPKTPSLGFKDPAPRHRNQPQPRHGLGPYAERKSSDASASGWRWPGHARWIAPDADRRRRFCGRRGGPVPTSLRPRFGCGSRPACELLGRFGNTVFAPLDIQLALSQPGLFPASLVNRCAATSLAALEAARLAGLPAPARAPAGGRTRRRLTCLANVISTGRATSTPGTACR